MASLADAHRYLNISGNDNDALVERLLVAATAYLARIGVTVEPMPEPVSEAVCLIVSIFYRRQTSDFGLRHSDVEGVGSETMFDPQAIDAANWNVIRLLTDPYREISL